MADPKEPIDLPLPEGCEHGTTFGASCSACRMSEVLPLIILGAIFAVGVAVILLVNLR